MLAVDQELRVIAKDSNDDLGQSSIGHIAKSLGLGDLAHVHCQPRVSQSVSRASTSYIPRAHTGSRAMPYGCW